MFLFLFSNSHKTFRDNFSKRHFIYHFTSVSGLS
jgi:hypothetical protein